MMEPPNLQPSTGHDAPVPLPEANGKARTETVLDLSERADERAAGQHGLDRTITTEPPPHDHVRAVAVRLLFIFGGCLFMILILATAIAWARPDALKDMINFFATIVATLGTLLGGVVAFYFTRK